MGTAIKTLEAADNGISSLTKLVESGQALARQAQQTQVAAERTALAAQFDALRTQIDQLAADSGFNGKNLLDGDNLSVVFNEDGTSSLTITGVTYDAAGLSIAASANNWAADADITAALTDLSDALTTLRSQAKTFGSNLSTGQTRQDFTKSMINTLRTGADSLTLADPNEEGANLLALQTRQQLSTTALSLAAQADQNVLRLFG
jgi:flagellin